MNRFFKHFTIFLFSIGGMLVFSFSFESNAYADNGVTDYTKSKHFRDHLNYLSNNTVLQNTPSNQRQNSTSWFRQYKQIGFLFAGDNNKKIISFLIQLIIKILLFK